MEDNWGFGISRKSVTMLKRNLWSLLTSIEQKPWLLWVKPLSKWVSSGPQIDQFYKILYIYIFFSLYHSFWVYMKVFYKSLGFKLEVQQKAFKLHIYRDNKEQLQWQRHWLSIWTTCKEWLIGKGHIQWQSTSSYPLVPLDPSYNKIVMKNRWVQEC